MLDKVWASNFRAWKVSVSYIKAKSDEPGKNESDKSSLRLGNGENLTFYWLHFVSWWLCAWLGWASFWTETAYRPMAMSWRYFHTSFFTSRRDSLKILGLPVTPGPEFLSKMDSTRRHQVHFDRTKFSVQGWKSWSMIQRTWTRPQEWRNRTLVGHEPLICRKMCFTKAELVQQ